MNYKLRLGSNLGDLLGMRESFQEACDRARSLANSEGSPVVVCNYGNEPLATMLPEGQ